MRGKVTESGSEVTAWQAVLEKELDYRDKARRAIERRCQFEYQGEWHEGKILDLSKDGAFIEANVVPEEGCQVRVAMGPLRWRSELACGGEVRHGGRYQCGYRNFKGFGVQFGPLGETARSLIRLLCKRMAEEPEQKVVME